MNWMGPIDWGASEQHASSMSAPFLMSTGVITGEGRGERPVSPPHTHPEPMLAWCYRGTLWVYLEDSIWRLAPGQGIWIPAHTPHTARHERDAVGCYTYVPDSALDAPVVSVTRVHVQRAVQEMMLHLGGNDMDPDLRVRIQGVLIDMLQLPAPDPLGDAGEIPVPGDERVRPLVETVLASPGDARTARELFAQHGLHERTVLRVFSNDIGMSFGQWRTGVRMTAAARLIVGGTPVGAAGNKCGYDSTSAFSAAFKGRFGMTPRQYAARAKADDAHRAYWR
ncbi:helix-turn-helix domain-containing protein [Leucobacter komagatae]|uniref:AraC family transcriptional regulator n=1 Tax=Leucobacter komagatae TaxID=55969 RepID=A0A0D0I0G2_9MICO|nr:AraC family transcriptional regulator [Leucobacter komagatae]KIP53286.1 AraC family transcriptional regulator [Leucobacter komagatae]